MFWVKGEVRREKVLSKCFNMLTKNGKCCSKNEAYSIGFAGKGWTEKQRRQRSLLSWAYTISASMGQQPSILFELQMLSLCPLLFPCAFFQCFHFHCPPFSATGPPAFLCVFRPEANTDFISRCILTSWSVGCTYSAHLNVCLHFY